MSLKKSLGGLNWVSSDVMPREGQRIIILTSGGTFHTRTASCKWDDVIAWAPQQDLEVKLVKIFSKNTKGSHGYTI